MADITDKKFKEDITDEKGGKKIFKEDITDEKGGKKIFKEDITDEKGGTVEPGEDRQNDTEIKYRGWKAMPCVIGNETFEKLGSIGTASNLMVYLTSVFHMRNVDAATTLNVFNGTTNMATVLGAFISDSYLGRYKTVAVGSIASLLGMLILTLTAGVPTLHPPKCSQGQNCKSATMPQLLFLVLAFLFIVAGAGGIRPCNLAFGADQFNPNSESGQKGITSFFNWYYFTFTIAVGLSSTLIIYIQTSVSWCIGYAIPAGLMFISCVFFFAGTNIYVKVKPEGSPFINIVRVFLAAFKKRWLEKPVDPAHNLFKAPHLSYVVSRLPYTEQFQFLDKAAIIASESEILSDGHAANMWSLCSLQQVEETKCILRTLPIWTTGFIYTVAFAQTTTYIVLQALQSNRHIGSSHLEIPAGSFTIFPMLALTLWIPLYDRLLLPWLQKFRGNKDGITLLERMGIGLVLSIVAMIISGIIEQKRRYYAIDQEPIAKHVTDGGGVISSFSSLWLILPLMILGLCEAFNNVSQLEFYYKQFPENMRSVAGSLLFSGMAISNYLSGLLVTIVHRTTGGYDRNSWLPDDLNKGRLDYYYYLIAFIGVLNFFYFLACAKWYQYKGVDDSSEEKLDSKTMLV